MANKTTKQHAQVEELDDADLDEDTDTELLETLKDENEESANDFLEDWTPPAQLQAPTPRPGFVQHWCRMSAQGQADTTQRIYNEQQGWRPRRADTLSPEDKARLAITDDSKLGEGIITQGSLVLCEMPARKADQRNKYYRNRHARQMASLVTNPIAETNQAATPGFGPIKMSQKSKVTTGRRNIAQSD